MRLEKCPNNHYYDADKYASCPHCAAANGAAKETVAVQDTGDDGVTQTLGANPAPVHAPISSPKEEPPKLFDGDDQQTIGLFQKKIGMEPVVGWLICTKGKHFGEDFRLKSGKNFIGRSDRMDIALTGEASVSREKHAIIVFEPKRCMFLAQPGDSKELFYLNDEVVLSPIQLKKNDLLQVGEAVLMFIPCCDDAFNWETEQNEQK